MFTQTKIGTIFTDEEIVGAINLLGDNTQPWRPHDKGDKKNPKGWVLATDLCHSFDGPMLIKLREMVTDGLLEERSYGGRHVVKRGLTKNSWFCKGRPRFRVKL
jgi:hypothetical protein